MQEEMDRYRHVLSGFVGLAEGSEMQGEINRFRFLQVQMKVGRDGQIQIYSLRFLQDQVEVAICRKRLMDLDMFPQILVGLAESCNMQEEMDRFRFLQDQLKVGICRKRWIDSDMFFHILQDQLQGGICRKRLIDLDMFSQIFVGLG